MQTQHNVNISGGTERCVTSSLWVLSLRTDFSSSRLCLYDFNFKYRRFNYRANLDYDMTPTTTLSVNIGGRVDNKNTPFSGEGQQPTFSVIFIGPHHFQQVLVSWMENS